MTIRRYPAGLSSGFSVRGFHVSWFPLRLLRSSIRVICSYDDSLNPDQLERCQVPFILYFQAQFDGLFNSYH